jgi:hypothetical protein
MALPALADLTALAGWLGEEIPPGDTRAATALGAASTLVRSETGQTWVDATSGDLTAVPDAVQVVTVQVAARLWRNPGGVVQDTTGPFTVRWAEAAGQGLYLTSTEKAVLAPFRLRRPLWTQRAGKDDDYLTDIATDTVYVDVAGGEPMPWYEAGDLAP